MTNVETSNPTIQIESPEPQPANTPVARWIGALVLAAFGLYGVGSSLIGGVLGGPIDQVLDSANDIRVGALLVIANTVAVVAIGVLMYRLATSVSRAVRLAYVSTRVLEGAFLTFVAVFGLMAITAADAESTVLVDVLTSGTDVSYQIAMIGLCVGSIPLFLSLTTSGAVPRWLGLFGIVGYAVFGIGATLEIFDVSVGVILAVPGGIFEIVFAIYLLWMGGLRSVSPVHA